MLLFRRSDGDLVKKLDPVRAMIPLLMRGRNESAIYVTSHLDVGHTRQWLRKFNRSRRGHERATLFHLVIFAAGRMLNDRTGVNRFAMNGRIYQRKGVFVSFAAKKELADDAPLSTVKLLIPQDEPFEKLIPRASGAIKGARSETERAIDREMRFFLKLPIPLLRLVVRAGMFLDKFNLLPAALIDPDPMYCSMFLANLGSVGIDNGFHHLYEYGTCSIFGVVGSVKKVPDGNGGEREMLQIGWTFDERVNDGFYSFGALEWIKNVVEHPERYIATEPDEELLQNAAANA